MSFNISEDYKNDDYCIGSEFQTDNYMNDLICMMEDNEETKDVADLPLQITPSVLVPFVKPGPPDRNTFPGPCNFNIEIYGNDTNKNKYIYSNRLNRIYVEMRTNFVLHFKYENAEGVPMVVRGTVVFADEAQAHARVERCMQHRHDVQEQDENQVMNVLHSASAPGTPGVQYCGSREPGVWYSVLVTIDKPGPHAYQFVCKHSCPGGINRRLIEIIFTLETINGRVLGRQVIGARACSCPKRDFRHDETLADKEQGGIGSRPGKRRLTKGPVQQSKKVKVESTDQTLTLPPIEIPRVDIMLAGLTTMLSMTNMAMEMSTNEPDIEKYKKSAEDIQIKINEYQNDTV